MMKKTPATYELTVADVKEAISDWLYNMHSVGDNDVDELTFAWEDRSDKDTATMVTVTELEEDE